MLIFCNLFFESILHSHGSKVKTKSNRCPLAGLTSTCVLTTSPPPSSPEVTTALAFLRVFQVFFIQPRQRRGSHSIAPHPYTVLYFARPCNNFFHSSYEQALRKAGFLCPSQVRKLRLGLLSHWCLSSLSLAPEAVWPSRKPGRQRWSWVYISPVQAWQEVGWGWAVRASWCPSTKVAEERKQERNV